MRSSISLHDRCPPQYCPNTFLHWREEVRSAHRTARHELTDSGQFKENLSSTTTTARSIFNHQAMPTPMMTSSALFKFSIAARPFQTFANSRLMSSLTSTDIVYQNLQHASCAQGIFNKQIRKILLKHGTICSVIWLMITFVAVRNTAPWELTLLWWGGCMIAKSFQITSSKGHKHVLSQPCFLPVLDDLQRSTALYLKHQVHHQAVLLFRPSQNLWSGQVVRPTPHRLMLRSLDQERNVEEEIQPDLLTYQWALSLADQQQDVYDSWRSSSEVEGLTWHCWNWTGCCFVSGMSSGMVFRGMKRAGRTSICIVLVLNSQCQIMHGFCRIITLTGHAIQASEQTQFPWSWRWTQRAHIVHMYSDPFKLHKEYEDDKVKVFYEKIRNISLRPSPIATSPASPFDEEWPCFFPTVLSSLIVSEVDATPSSSSCPVNFSKSPCWCDLGGRWPPCAHPCQPADHTCLNDWPLALLPKQQRQRYHQSVPIMINAMATPKQIAINMVSFAVAGLHVVSSFLQPLLATGMSINGWCKAGADSVKWFGVVMVVCEFRVCSFRVAEQLLCVPIDVDDQVWGLHYGRRLRARFILFVSFLASLASVIIDVPEEECNSDRLGMLNSAWSRRTTAKNSVKAKFPANRGLQHGKAINTTTVSSLCSQLSDWRNQCSTVEPSVVLAKTAGNVVAFSYVCQHVPQKLWFESWMKD